MRQHETLPGPGPGPGRNPALTGAPGVRPVEQMVDAAIERLAHERGAHERDAHEDEPGEQRTHATSNDERALVVPNDSSARERRLSTRLRWKGLDVSDEFRRYAERVARGEDLPPFEGPVLAEPNPAFPFGPAPAARESAQEVTAGSGRTSRIAVWTSAAVVLGLIGWSLTQRVDAESSADLNTAPPPSAATDVATSTATSPHDVVETPPAPPVNVPEAQAAAVNQVTAMTDGAPLTAAPSAPNQAVEAPLHAAVADVSSGEVTASSLSPVVAEVPVPTPAAAPPGPIAVAGASLEPAVSTPPQPAGPGAGPAASAAAPAKAMSEEDFGILPAGDGAPVSTPANTALPAAKSVASVNGNVGDLARSGQVPAGPARKEPGSESSAKGSLLVETPSF